MRKGTSGEGTELGMDGARERREGGSERRREGSTDRARGTREEHGRKGDIEREGNFKCAVMMTCRLVFLK